MLQPRRQNEWHQISINGDNNANISWTRVDYYNEKEMWRNCGEFASVLFNLRHKQVSVVICVCFNIFQYCHSIMMWWSYGQTNGSISSSNNTNKCVLLICMIYHLFTFWWQCAHFYCCWYFIPRTTFIFDSFSF